MESTTQAQMAREQIEGASRTRAFQRFNSDSRPFGATLYSLAPASLSQDSYVEHSPEAYHKPGPAGMPSPKLADPGSPSASHRLPRVPEYSSVDSATSAKPMRRVNETSADNPFVGATMVDRATTQRTSYPKYDAQAYRDNIPTSPIPASSSPRAPAEPTRFEGETTTARHFTSKVAEPVHPSYRPNEESPATALALRRLSSRDSLALAAGTAAAAGDSGDSSPSAAAHVKGGSTQQAAYPRYSPDVYKEHVVHAGAKPTTRRVTVDAHADAALSPAARALAARGAAVTASAFDDTTTSKTFYAAPDAAAYHTAPQSHHPRARTAPFA